MYSSVWKAVISKGDARLGRCSRLMIAVSMDFSPPNPNILGSPWRQSTRVWLQGA